MLLHALNDMMAKAATSNNLWLFLMMYFCFSFILETSKPHIFKVSTTTKVIQTKIKSLDLVDDPFLLPLSYAMAAAVLSLMIHTRLTLAKTLRFSDFKVSQESTTGRLVILVGFSFDTEKYPMMSRRA